MQDDGDFCIYRGTGPQDRWGLLWQANCAVPDNSILRMGDSLATWGSLVSANGAYNAVLQSDGNFCVYKGDGPSHQLLWDTGPHGGDSFTLALQSDGRVCLMRKDTSSVVWVSPVISQSAPSFFVKLHDDSTLCIHAGSGPCDDGGPLWQANAPDPAADPAEVVKQQLADIIAHTSTPWPDFSQDADQQAVFAIINAQLAADDYQLWRDLPVMAVERIAGIQETYASTHVLTPAQTTAWEAVMGTIDTTFALKDELVDFFTGIDKVLTDRQAWTGNKVLEISALMQLDQTIVVTVGGTAKAPISFPWLAWVYNACPRAVARPPNC
jgi:hypothetical protein